VVAQPVAERGGERLVLFSQREVHAAHDPDIEVTLVGPP
jgi:hypothetical protein